jgi:methylmalonyl-CoA mutase cobalamin-binding subunit
MEDNERTFEQQKTAVLQAAKEEGIIDIVLGAGGGISLETVELATRLMKKYGPSIYKELSKHRQKPE